MSMAARTKNIFAFLLITASLTGGLLIYAGGRPGDLPLTLFVSKFHPDIPLNFPETSGWINNSLPDALWMFALTTSILLLWNFCWTIESILWFVSAILLGIGLEIAQGFIGIPGTFDPVDLTSLVIAGMLPIFFTLDFRRHEKELV